MEMKIKMPPTLKSSGSRPTECHSIPNRPDRKADCAGCRNPIREKYMLKAVDQLWHEDCLKCSCCDCRLGEVGSTLFAKANLILCKRDYLRLFGNTGYCSACNKIIPAFEMVMRAKTNVYHLECFACQQCNHRFCVGDKFYLCNDKILCEYDYEERLVFANMSYNYNSIAHIKRQTQNITPNNNSLAHMTAVQNETVTSFPNNISPGVAAVSAHSQSDDTSSGYGSPESPMFDRK
ncbi:LMO1 (predicted) [Pycnogonum litorale]